MKFKDMTYFNSKVISDLRDGLRWGIGAEYKPRPNISLRCGYMRDEYIVESNSLSPFLVDLSSNIANCGIGLKFGNLKLELFSSYVAYLSREGTGAFPGKYSGDGVTCGLEIGCHF